MRSEQFHDRVSGPLFSKVLMFKALTSIWRAGAPQKLAASIDAKVAERIDNHA